MIVEVDIVVNHFICFIKGSRFVSADTFGFQNEEEVFCHGVVIRIILLFLLNWFIPLPVFF